MQDRFDNKQDVLTEDNVGQFMDLELSTKNTPTSGDTVLARDILTNKAVEIPIESLGGGSGLELGETSSTAYRGDRGKIAYDHSQVTHDKTLVGLGNVPNLDTTNPANIIQSASYRFVTDAEKATWNGKASTAVATASANGLMSSADKTKLDGIAKRSK